MKYFLNDLNVFPEWETWSDLMNYKNYNVVRNADEYVIETLENYLSFFYSMTQSTQLINQVFLV